MDITIYFFLACFFYVLGVLVGLAWHKDLKQENK